MSDFSALEMIPTYRIRRGPDGRLRGDAIVRGLNLFLRWRYHDEADEDSLDQRGWRVGKRLAEGDSVTANDLDLFRSYIDHAETYYFNEQHDVPILIERYEQVQRDIAAVREWLLPVTT